MTRLAGLLAAVLLAGLVRSSGAAEPRPHVAVRGIYGGVPQEVLDSGRSLAEFGIDAVWMGSGSFTPERVALLRSQKVRVFAEFNTLHVADYLKDHPDAAPIGSDGRVSPPPDGWQGICPSHEPYRRSRMDAFRRLLREFEVDGVWLDYHHSHASWEQAVPNMPDTCFCDRCLGRFQKETGVRLGDASTAERARLLLSTHRQRWVRWRCDLLTDWVREFREIRDATRPAALLGTFHNPWSDEDHGGARLEKLAIDLQGAGLPHRRLQPHALSRPLRARRGAGVDLAAGGLAGPSPRPRGRAGGEAPHLADRADLRLGRNGTARAGAGRARPRLAPARHRCHGLRLGRAAEAARRRSRRSGARFAGCGGRSSMPPHLKGEAMAESVYKIIELVGTSTESWEKAAAAAVNLAGKSLRDLRVAEIVSLDMNLEDGKVKAYRAKVKVSFKYQGGK